MKISRKFKINDTTELTFTTVLSSSELSDAYYEKEVEFDREDIVNKLNEIFEADEDEIRGISRFEITEEMIDCMACKQNIFQIIWYA